MRNHANGPVYRLVTGQTKNDRLEKCYFAGTASFVEEGQYYLLRLPMFPGASFYLKKQPNSQNGYAVYSEYHREASSHPFRCAVGYARLSPKLKTHLEIRFGLFSRPIFMDLFPTQS